MGFAPLTVAVEGGGHMALDERDLVQMTLFRTGTYEPEIWDALSRNIRSGEVFWDIGAFVGYFSVRALRDRRVREVHAFEPNPHLAARLRHNLKLNGNHWKHHQTAIGDAIEQRTLFFHPLPLVGSTSLVNDFGAGGQAVDVTTIDALVFEQGMAAPTILKIDVEDWEYKLFLGARRLFAECPPHALVFETACDNCGRLLEDHVVEFLKGAGYHIDWLKRFDGIKWERENFLAVRSSN
jgi:FkbM family methyltransferase